MVNAIFTFAAIALSPPSTTGTGGAGQFNHPWRLQRRNPFAKGALLPPRGGSATPLI